jgi:lipopolysaccharide/colanic/teichoic acid biosynthesis glycosyltransferase
MDNSLPIDERRIRRRWHESGYSGQRILDVSLGLFVLLLSLPILAVAALLVRVTSRGPIIYSQMRAGRDGVPFRILKLRTMRVDSETESGAVWATRRDPRITTVGRILRALHLDEIPQLWNVIRGEMSLVGPRPERPEIIERLEPEIAGYRQRLAVRPGMTGLAQIQHPADESIESVREKLKYDLVYTQNVSFALDLKILWGTLFYLVQLPYGMVRWIARLPQPPTAFYHRHESLGYQPYPEQPLTPYNTAG